MNDVLQCYTRRPVATRHRTRVTDCLSTQLRQKAVGLTWCIFIYLFYFQNHTRNIHKKTIKQKPKQNEKAQNGPGNGNEI